MTVNQEFHLAEWSLWFCPTSGTTQLSGWFPTFVIPKKISIPGRVEDLLGLSGEDLELLD